MPETLNLKFTGRPRFLIERLFEGGYLELSEGDEKKATPEGFFWTVDVPTLKDKHDFIHELEDAFSDYDEDFPVSEEKIDTFEKLLAEVRQAAGFHRNEPEAEDESEVEPEIQIETRDADDHRETLEFSSVEAFEREYPEYVKCLRSGTPDRHGWVACQEGWVREVDPRDTEDDDDDADED